jgi:hypothetical protein
MKAFVRQSELLRHDVSLVIPQACQPPSRFSFHYIPQDNIDRLLEDDAEIDTGFLTLKVSDGVLGLFETVSMSHNEFGWSFASSRVVDVLAAIRVGETLDIELERPFGEIYKITRSHFPPGIPDSGYGLFRVHICEDAVTPAGFRIVSSFEEGQVPTRSRLPFFFGFRVFGTDPNSASEPVWRTFLRLSILYCQDARWHLSVLHSAFCIESFIDALLKNKILLGVAESYIEHILRVGDKRNEFNAINEMLLKRKLTGKQVNRLYEDVNSRIFKKRNGLAHGGTLSQSITQADALDAIRCAVSLIWNFDPSSRSRLLIVTGSSGPQSMIDAELIDRCLNER